MWVEGGISIGIGDEHFSVMLMALRGRWIELMCYRQTDTILESAVSTALEKNIPPS